MAASLNTLNTSDSIQPHKSMNLIVYKKKADGEPLTGGKINCLSRIKDGVNNIECDLLESNYLAGIEKRRV